MKWRVEEWYINGNKTGWRVVRGYGWDMEIDSGYAYDRYLEGDEKAKFAIAGKRCEELNQ